MWIWYFRIQCTVECLCWMRNSCECAGFVYSFLPVNITSMKSRLLRYIFIATIRGCSSVPLLLLHDNNVSEACPGYCVRNLWDIVCWRSSWNWANRPRNIVAWLIHGTHIITQDVPASLTSWAYPLWLFYTIVGTPWHTHIPWPEGQQWQRRRSTLEALKMG